jgi:hypothetical protein
MKLLRFALVLLATLALSVSFVIPAEDLLDTAYDESEALPYECTSSFFITQHESALAPTQGLPAQFQREAKRRVLAQPSEHEAHSICDSVTILDQSLRC